MCDCGRVSFTVWVGGDELCDGVLKPLCRRHVIVKIESKVRMRIVLCGVRGLQLVSCKPYLPIIDTLFWTHDAILTRTVLACRARLTATVAARARSAARRTSMDHMHAPLLYSTPCAVMGIGHATQTMT